MIFVINLNLFKMESKDEKWSELNMVSASPYDPALGSKVKKKNQLQLQEKS
jgi:hypothetical protein